MSPASLARAAAAGMEITEGSPLVGRTLQQLGGPAVPLLVRHADGQLIANPTSELQLQAGDALVVSGEASGLNPLDRE
jgi:K+/H+ antiporter YhaU regulatory subunit KhtT